MHIHVGEGLNRGCKIAAELIILFQRLGISSVSWEVLISSYKYFILSIRFKYLMVSKEDDGIYV